MPCSYNMLGAYLQHCEYLLLGLHRLLDTELSFDALCFVDLASSLQVVQRLQIWLRCF